jgi:hypothetical protein
MRIALVSLLSMVTFFCLIALSTHAADEKENREKEKQEKEEKQREKTLAAADALFEKDDWAVQAKQSIAKLTGELLKADTIEVFRLDPGRLSGKGKDAQHNFHDYAILGRTTAGTAEKRKQIATFLGKTFHWNSLRKAACFNPRHGVRGVVGKQTIDLVICFECWRVNVFVDDKPTYGFALTPPKNNLLEQLLREAEKKKK